MRSDVKKKKKKGKKKKEKEVWLLQTAITCERCFLIKAVSTYLTVNGKSIHVE